MPQKKKKDKKDELEETLSLLQEKFGEGAIMRLGETKTAPVETISTSSLALNLALGVGGIPKGRIIEIFGPESSGKSTLALHILAEAQKKGGIVAFIDAEHAFDPDYAKKLGVKVEDLLISQPESGEQALDIVESLVRTGKISAIAIDSVAALTPRAEIEGEMGEQQIGLQARLMSQALRKLTGLAAKANTTIIFLNQTRMKIQTFGFGQPETTPGGLALKFYASIRIELKPVAKIKKGDQVIGIRVRAKVVKNKLAPPFKQAEFDIFYNEGISKEADILNTGLQYGVIEKKGGSFEFEGLRLGSSTELAKKFLKTSPQILEKIEKKIREKWAKENILK